MRRPPDQLDYVLYHGDRHSRFSSETPVERAIEIMRIEEQQEEDRRDYARRQKAHIFDRDHRCTLCGQNAVEVNQHRLPCN